MFGFGKSSADAAAASEVEVERLATRERRLREKLAAAEGELANAKMAQRELLTTGDDDESMVESVASDEVRTLADRCASRRDAADEIGRQRREAEGRLAQARDRVERERIAATMLETHTAIDARLGVFRRASADLAGALLNVSAAQMSAIQLDQFADSFGGQVAALLADFECRRTALLSGATPLSAIKVAEPHAIEAPPPPIERVRVFTLEAVRWIDEGAKTAIKFSIIDLPVDTARRALGAGAVLPMGDKRVGNITDGWGNTGIRAYGPAWQPLPVSETRDLDTIGEPIAGEIAA
jgi:hypothetical protein